MSRLVALDWDTSEARVAVGQLRAGEVILEHAFTVPLSAERLARAWDAEEFGARLGRELAARGVGRSPLLVAVGRDAVELKRLRVPAAPLDELASLVRFQAQREFHAFTSDWSLDFLRLAGSDREPHQLLAAAAGPELFQRIASASRAAGLNLRAVVLRPCSVASLVLRSHRTASERVFLVVDPLADKAELTVVADKKVVLMRSVRLPDIVEPQGHGGTFRSGERSRVLEMELRRTMAAGQEELQGQRVGAVYVSSSPEDNVGLAEQLHERLSLPAYSLDPLPQITLSSQLKHFPPPHAAHFAPLVGLLLDEADNIPHTFDFLRARRTARHPNRRTTWALLAAAAVLLLAAALAHTWRNWNDLDRQIAYATQQLAQVEARLKATQEIQDRAEQVERWMATDIVWLDELLRLSQRFPQPQDAMLQELHLVLSADSGAVTLKGSTRDHQVIDALVQALRDARHTIQPQSSYQDQNRQPYLWQFESTMSVKR